MNPDISPDQFDAARAGMPGVRDFEATIMFKRGHGDTTEHTTMRVRIPAVDEYAAGQLAGVIGAHIAIATGNTPAGGPLWRHDTDDVTVIDVDDTPSPAELAAELDHWRRVITVLAGKLTGLTVVTGEEYAAADFSELGMVPMPDGSMMFATRTSMSSAPTLAATREAADPGQVPPTYGAYDDPDASQIDAHSLPAYPTNRIDLAFDGRWMTVTDIDITADLGVRVTLRPPHQDGFITSTFTDLAQKVTIRPAAVESLGSDLVAAAQHFRQILTGDGWMIVTAAGWNGAFSNTYKALLARPADDRAADAYESSFTATDKVLLREQPGGWWTP